MKALLIVTLLLFTELSLSAQRGILTWENKKLDLGKVMADDQPMEIKFKFKNTGETPVVISQVSPYFSKGKASWDKSPVLPGAESVITITFTNTDLPESFRYTVNVNSNAQVRNEKLEFSGELVENPRKPYLLFKVDFDSVKFKTNNVSFRNVLDNQVIKDTLEFYNTKKVAVKTTALHIPQSLKIQSVPEVVPPGKKGLLILTFDAREKKDYGYVYESLLLQFNENKSYKNRISVNAHIREDFSTLSAQELENAPVASFKEKTINFGTIKQGEKADCDFVLTNTGKSTLIIRKTKASCGCTALTLGENTIAPGASTTIRATFDSRGKNGRQHKSVTVITNDPKNPEVGLNITGEIGQ